MLLFLLLTFVVFFFTENNKILLTSQLDHLQARWMQKQATTVGLYCRHMVVRWRLLLAMK